MPSDGMPSLEQEIIELEGRLADARARLSAQVSDRKESNGQYDSLTEEHTHSTSDASSASSASNDLVDNLHNLFLLSDSALPLGSFAFSSGLESYLAHTPKSSHSSTTFSRFLGLSLASLACTTLPFVIAGYESPEELETLDNDLDAGTSCIVAKRASVKQGKALLAVWARSFRAQAASTNRPLGEKANAAHLSLEAFAASIKEQQSSTSTRAFGHHELNGHLPPLFGATCAAFEIPVAHALYMYLFNHAKTIVSAGVRASVLGPYQAQSVLASYLLRSKIQTLVRHEIGTDGRKQRRSTSEVGQSVPMLDMWGGRHEIIYSRIFNS